MFGDLGVTNTKNMRDRQLCCKQQTIDNAAQCDLSCDDVKASPTSKNRLMTSQESMPEDGLELGPDGEHSHWGGPTNVPTKEAGDLTSFHCPI